MGIRLTSYILRNSLNLVHNQPILKKIISGDATYEDYVANHRIDGSEERPHHTVNKAIEELEENKKDFMIRNVPKFGKKSVLDLRPEKSDSTKACNVLCGKIISVERPLLHKLIAELNILIKNTNDNVIDYLSRADDMQYNYPLLKEGVCKKMYNKDISKELPYESFRTILNSCLK